MFVNLTWRSGLVCVWVVCWTLRSMGAKILNNLLLFVIFFCVYGFSASQHIILGWCCFRHSMKLTAFFLGSIDLSQQVDLLHIPGKSKGYKCVFTLCNFVLDSIWHFLSFLSLLCSKYIYIYIFFFSRCVKRGEKEEIPLYYTLFWPVHPNGH